MSLPFPGWAARARRLKPLVRAFWPRPGRPRPAVTAVVQHFLGERLALRAAALTYISIFSLVPLATLALHLLASFQADGLRLRVHRFIAEVLSPGVRADSAALLDALLRSAAARSVSWVSLAALLVAGGTLLKSLDGAINELWQVKRPRPFWLQVALYGAAMVLGPLFLAASLVSSSQLRALLLLAHLPRAWVALSSFLSLVLALTLAYAFLPRAHVRARPALLGAAVAAVSWGAARVGYASFAARIFRYNVLYGSLGAIPLFLTWLYLSWWIVLFGARLSYAVQHASYRDTWPLFELHPHASELLAARLAQEFARAWEAGRPLLVEPLAELVHGPLDSVAAAVRAFEAAGLVTGLGPGAYAVARSPTELTLKDACLALRVAGRAERPRLLLRTPPELASVEAALARAQTLADQALGSLSWAELGRGSGAVDHLSRPRPTGVGNP